MRCDACFFLFLIFRCQLVFAAPSNSTSTQTTPSVTPSESARLSPSHLIAGATPISHSSSHTHHAPSHMTHRPAIPHPLPTPHPNNPTPPTPVLRHSSHSHSPVAIAFEVIAGLVGLVILFNLVRCVYSYKRTPRRDRIEALVNRHRLQREMEELERNPPMRRRSLQSPPPPYIPKPPPYIEVSTTPPDEEFVPPRPG